MLVYRSVGVSKNRGNDPTRPGKGSGINLPLLGFLGTLCLPGKVLASGLFNGCLGISDVGPWAIHVALLQASLSAGELWGLQALPEVVHVELVKHQWADHDSTNPCNQLHRDAMKSNESPHIDSKAQILGPQCGDPYHRGLERFCFWLLMSCSICKCPDAWKMVKHERLCRLELWVLGTKKLHWLPQSGLTDLHGFGRSRVENLLDLTAIFWPSLMWWFIMENPENPIKMDDLGVPPF